MPFKTYFLIGGAGFIGSHFTDALLKQKDVQKVTLYDNFSVGRLWHYEHHCHDPRFSVIKGNVKDLSRLTQVMNGHDVVIHLASNSDISQAATNPTIDFTEGFYLTYQVLEAARLNAIRRIIYISGSGVYGDTGATECREDQGSLLPISIYGASKLAGEAFLSSYCHMFGLTSLVFRLANVVGPRQTHGVGYDFVRRLFNDKSSLRLLGDGSQSKSYIHVEDVVSAVLLANESLQTPFEIYNVASPDYLTVMEIAEIIVSCLGLDKQVAFKFTGGDRGWQGDVPIIRLNTDKIRALGWTCQRNSREAIKDSVSALIDQIERGLIPKINSIESTPISNQLVNS